ncbi:MAG: hypothetical protein QW156_03905 [Candidatus Aenigmatarchaeota archaeon]
MVDYIDLILIALGGAVSVFSAIIFKGLNKAKAIIDEIENALKDGTLTREEILEIIKRFKE